MDVKVLSVKGENDKLRSEVEWLVMELGALPEAGRQAPITKAFDGDERTEHEGYDEYFWI
jgi:hypothetical protein